MRFRWAHAVTVFIAVFGLMFLTPSAVAKTLLDGDVEAGRKLYWHGLNESGEPITATAQGDIEFTGTQFSCVSCHRPSGFGSSEGGHYVPPITGPQVFSPAGPDRVQRFKEMFQESQPSSFWAQLREPRLRPPYDEQTLARALRDGINPNGERLNPVMPRYQIGDKDMRNLIAFMRTLSAEIDPGVEQDSIHFATVVTEGADPDARFAMLETMRRFFTWMNKDTAGDLDHPTFSPGYRSTFLDAYRRWNLHVWQLSGAPETWPRQLQTYYAKQPVFSVISGLVQGPWERIGNFCDQQRLPCLFPNSELPRLSDVEYGYSLYFSGGLALEARAIATYLSKLPEAPQRVAHIWHDDPYAEIPAHAFVSESATLLPDTIIENLPYRDETELITVFERLAAEPNGRAIVLWPGEKSVAALSVLACANPGSGLIALPSNTLDLAAKILSDSIVERVVFTYPYELPAHYHPRKFRVRAWMHSRRLEVTHPRLQYQTYYALTLAQYGLAHLLTDFHRDYLIELIEHEAENQLNPGTHPALALGPGQRLASKGVYVVGLDPSAKGGFKALSDWIVP